jgi:predicted Holliday junction resolvase-like endonuclease
MIELIVVIFGLVIVFLLFLVVIMQRRIQQLLNDVNRLSGKMQVTTTELEELTKNVEHFKKLQL